MQQYIWGNHRNIIENMCFRLQEISIDVHSGLGNKCPLRRLHYEGLSRFRNKHLRVFYNILAHPGRRLT